MSTVIREGPVSYGKWHKEIQKKVVVPKPKDYDYEGFFKASRPCCEEDKDG